MPEPDEGKLSSPVLRGGGSREAPLLPGVRNNGKEIGGCPWREIGVCP